MKLAILMVFTVGFVTHVQAALMVFTDRTEFENATSLALELEGFNDKAQLRSEIVGIEGTGRYTSSKYLVSEGVKALYIKENNDLTIHFSHEVFALGFDVNELNGSSLSFIDSNGRVFENIFEPTEDPFESNFFGFISDTPLTSFTLSSSGTATQYAYYGVDALYFSADPNKVYTPATLLLLLIGLFAVFWFKRSQHSNR